MFFLQKSTSTIRRIAKAHHLAALYRVDNVVVVPAELSAGLDGLRGEQGYPGKARIVRVYEHALYKHVWRARVIEVATDVAGELGVHDEAGSLFEVLVDSLEKATRVHRQSGRSAVNNDQVVFVAARVALVIERVDVLVVEARHATLPLLGHDLLLLGSLIEATV